MSSKELDRALNYLANQMLNQVGITWEEACNSTEIVWHNLEAKGFKGDALIERLYCEATPYEDM